MAGMFRHAHLYGPGNGDAQPPKAAMMRRPGRYADGYDDVTTTAAEHSGSGFFMATLTALVFWAVIALMILYIVI